MTNSKSLDFFLSTIFVLGIVIVIFWGLLIWYSSWVWGGIGFRGMNDFSFWPYQYPYVVVSIIILVAEFFVWKKINSKSSKR